MPLPSVSEIEAIELTIGKGQRASGLLRALEPFTEEMTDKLLDTLLIRGDNLTDEAMRLIVGQILGLRKLKQFLDQSAIAGRVASERRDGR